MYREKFISYLQTFTYEGKLQQVIDYLLKNTNASYTRAQLTLAWCDECDGDIEKALPLALAVECIHVSSLIQDDLPCMDNSAERRGKMSVHLLFGEDSALLASDVLINLAYQIILQSDLDNINKLECMHLLSNLFLNLCEGQYLDLQQSNYSLNDYLMMVKLKTSSLIQLACAFGVIAANKTEAYLNKALLYGEIIGLIYQIQDDIKDDDGIMQLTSRDKVNTVYSNAKALLPENYTNQFLMRLKEKLLC